jgi:hypothetical protein
MIEKMKMKKVNVVEKNAMVHADSIAMIDHARW